MTDYTIKEATEALLGPPFNTPEAAALVKWPRPYRSYPTDQAFNAELARIAQSGIRQSPDASSGVQVHAATIQPYSKPDAKGSEDRHTVQFWDLSSGIWTFAAIFDGHAGVETAAYAVQALPQKVRESLEALGLLSLGPHSVESVSAVLKSSIEVFDKSISDDLLAILPCNLEDLSDEEAEKIANDEENSQKILRCMRGSTALVVLIDPGRENLWVANLGDCQAVLARSGDDGKGIDIQTLTSPHNGRVEAEELRIKAEHPGEERAIFNNRVLGAIAVTRALGDFEFKLPAIYTNKIFLKVKTGFRVRTKVEEFILNNLTPPYLTATPDVIHKKLENVQYSLILCSDGLTDLYHEREIVSEEATLRLAKLALEKGDREELAGLGGNKALHIMKDGLGEHLEMQSAFLTIDIDFPHLDDITAAVLQW